MEPTAKVVVMEAPVVEADEKAEKEEKVEEVKD